MLEEIPEKIIVEEPEEKQSWYQGPLKVILGLFLLLLVVLWIVPHYGLKQNPEPNYTPTLAELNIPEMQIPEIDSPDIRNYLQTTSEIKQLADKVVTLSCPQTHKVCNAKALFYFVQKNFNYVNDPLHHEYYKTPQETLTSAASDCDDFSVLTASLLRSVGFPTRFVRVPGHIYLQVRIPEAVSSYKTEQAWINLDPTCTSCQFGEIHYQYTDSNKQFVE